jgi:biopolymer transport protein ExbD
MPKVKIKTKSPELDMAPMCDMAFLLLTFFILTSTFIQKEVVQVNTPSSVSEIKIPETNVIMVFVEPSNGGKVFFGIDGQQDRKDLLGYMGGKYGIAFTPEEMETFSNINNFGVPMKMMKQYLDAKPEERDTKAWQIGIPNDTLNDYKNSEIKDWVQFARQIKESNKGPQGKSAKLAIKADQTCPYPIIKTLMNTFQKISEDRYSLITSLEQNPEKINY